MSSIAGNVSWAEWCEEGKEMRLFSALLSVPVVPLGVLGEANMLLLDEDPDRLVGFVLYRACVVMLCCLGLLQAFKLCPQN